MLNSMGSGSSFPMLGIGHVCTEDSGQYLPLFLPYVEILSVLFLIIKEHVIR